MTEELVLKLSQDAMKTTAMIATPMLLGTLVIGLGVSIFQALTQINEATLTFVPKIVFIGIVVVVAGPWMLDVMTQYTIGLFESLSTMVRE
jgi:flagellar biosynthetic protein FliQ